MPFIIRAKSNLKYLLIIISLAIVADVGIIIYSYIINKQIQEILR